MAQKILPYGTWPSPLSAQQAAASSPRRDGARFVGDDVWWGESVPEEGGRMSVRSLREGMLLPAPWNIASRVHEYGGGAWTASDDGRLFFVDKGDQAVWERGPGGTCRRVSSGDADERFGGLDWQRGRLLAIRERHTGPRTPSRDIVEIIPGPTPRVVPLAAGTDFLAHPALSPDGTRLAWIGWDHPAMPWDRTTLRVAVIDDGPQPTAGTVLAGTAADGAETAPLQPAWLDEDVLLYTDDPTGRWNLRRIDTREPAAGSAPVAAADADTGGPVWVLGTRWYAVTARGRIVAVRTDGADRIVRIDRDGRVSALEPAITAAASITDVSGERVLVLGSGPSGSGLWCLDAEAGTSERLAGAEPPWPAAWTPVPRQITVSGPHGPVHAVDYPPTAPDVQAPEGERPPYVVFVHGGPTSHTAPAVSAKTTFFTSRGIGVLDVNYGGSSGYGRAYRERLRGQWGVVDVDDVAAAATGLAAEGRADPDRLAIEGGSAGGWTVLAALTGTDVFAAGISRYGVGDARTLATDTHDFESRYLDGLIGPLPEAEERYRERSPLSHPERFTVPVLLLQGEDDPIVPPNQAVAIRDALARRGVPHACVFYPGESHGFRRPETTVDVLEKEVGFLAAVFGFTPAAEPVLDLR